MHDLLAVVQPREGRVGLVQRKGLEMEKQAHVDDVDLE